MEEKERRRGRGVEEKERREGEFEEIVLADSRASQGGW